MSDYRNLEAWKKAHELRLEIYRVTAAFPSPERFGLVDQARRAASSITSNIAEGAGRGSDREFARYVSISIGSANETDDHLLLSRDLGYIDHAQWTDLSDRIALIRAMLIGLRRYLRGHNGGS